MAPVTPEPAPSPPARPVPSTDGVTLALHDLGGEGPPVLFGHPTGFLGMTWAPMAAEMAAVAHGWALDFRGHGDSTAPATMDFAWRGMGDDVLAVVAELGPGPLVAVGHSMGGTALLMAEQRRPGTFAALWMYEPIVSPGPRPDGPRHNLMAAAARRRRPWFPDREAAYANFAAKQPLNALTPAALRAYVEHGLADRGDGTVALKCTPEVEARVFEGSMGHDTFTRLGEVRCPVTVVAGGEAAGPAVFAPLVAAALPQGRLETHPDLTHFGPMEAPARMAASARRALWGEGHPAG